MGPLAYLAPEPPSRPVGCRNAAAARDATAAVPTVLPISPPVPVMISTYMKESLRGCQPAAAAATIAVVMRPRSASSTT